MVVCGRVGSPASWSRVEPALGGFNTERPKHPIRSLWRVAAMEVEPMFNALGELLDVLPEEQLSLVLLGLLEPGDPSYDSFSAMLSDDVACGLVLFSMRELCGLPHERWGSAAAAHRCCKAGGCLAGLAASHPELLDSLRARLLLAREAGAAAEQRRAILPDRKPLQAMRHREGSAVVSELQRQAEAQAHGTRAHAHAHRTKPPSPHPSPRARGFTLHLTCTLACNAYL